MFTVLKLNATTTWETWSPTDGTHSHPWSGSPASAISSGLVGVRALSPTHERYLISPQLGDGAFEVHAVVPTIRGGIEVQAVQTASGLMTMKFNSPANMVARVCLPSFGGAFTTLTVDSKHVDAEVDGDYLCVGSLGSGGHTVAASKGDHKLNSETRQQTFYRRERPELRLDQPGANLSLSDNPNLSALRLGLSLNDRLAPG